MSQIQRNIIKTHTGPTKGLFLLALLAIAGALFAPTTHAADSLTVTSSGAQSINISSAGSDPTTGISTAISKDQITVSTTCRSGYNFTMSTSVNNNNLYLNGSSSNNTSGTYFSPISGSTALNSSANTWGYYYNADGTTPTASSTFSPIPALGSTVATIKSPLTTPSTTDISDEFSLYYGVAMDSSMPLGTYKLIPDTNNSNQDGTIVYYTTIADACVSYTVHYDPTGIFNGQSITGTGTVADQTIPEGVATPLTTSTFTGPTIGGTTYYFTGWNTARDGSGTSYAKGETVTDLTTVGSTITLYAQWTDCPGGHICYDKNEGSDTSHQVVGTMGQQSVSSSATSTTLLASNFSRDTYGFAGWSPDQTITSSSKIYGPQESITFTAGQYATVGLKLYAVWVASAGSIQDTNTVSSVCSNLTKAPTDGTANLSSVSALTDQRDGQTYAVAKLADGNCWMIENLRLESTNSDNSTGALAQGYGTSTIYGNFSGLADAESTGFTSTYTANSLYYSGTQEGTASVNIGTADYPAYRMPRYNNYNNQSTSEGRPQNPTTNSATNSTTKAGMYSYGNYYTWHAAIADTTYNGTNNKSSDTTSICPSGWRLPHGGQTTVNTTAEFYLLGKAIMNNLEPDQNASGGYGYYGNSVTNTSGKTATVAFRSFPNNFLYSGYFITSSAYNRGGYGIYWSSTADDNGISYGLSLNSSSVYPGTGSNNKLGGYSIRCLAGS